MNYQVEALNWVRKHGLRQDLDHRTMVNALNIILDHALEIAESREDLDLIEKTRINLYEHIQQATSRHTANALQH